MNRLATVPSAYAWLLRRQVVPAPFASWNSVVALLGNVSLQTDEPGRPATMGHVPAPEPVHDAPVPLHVPLHAEFDVHTCVVLTLQNPVQSELATHADLSMLQTVPWGRHLDAALAAVQETPVRLHFRFWSGQAVAALAAVQTALVLLHRPDCGQSVANVQLPPVALQVPVCGKQRVAALLAVQVRVV